MARVITARFQANPARVRTLATCFPGFYAAIIVAIHFVRHHDVQQKKATVGDGHMFEIFVCLSPRCSYSDSVIRMLLAPFQPTTSIQQLLSYQFTTTMHVHDQGIR